MIENPTTKILAEMSLRDFNPNSMITMMGRRHCSLEDVRGAFIHLINKTQRTMYGKRTNTVLKYLAVAEMNEAHQAHFHTLMDIETEQKEEFLKILYETWISLDNGSSIGITKDIEKAKDGWFKEITDLNGAVSYLFKNHTNQNKHLFIDLVM